MTDLPDFHIPHAEKIEWMIETAGWALEAGQGYAYSIGFPEAFGFPEVAVFGLTPVAIRGLLDLVADLLRGGTEIPLEVELVGLFDNDLRCVFDPVDLDTWGHLFATARAWYRGRPFEMAQLLWPDRNGFLPTEAGFDQRVRQAQPVLSQSAGR